MSQSTAVLIAGGTGLIGQALKKHLVESGQKVLVLTRGQTDLGQGLIHWDPSSSLDLDHVAAESASTIKAIVNLAGFSISKMPWTPKRKTLILSSRIQATRTLAHAIAHAQKKPETFLSGSAVGFYGNRDEEILTEQSEPGTGFLAEVTQQWEAATEAAHGHTRIVHLRTGLVLAHQGALTPMKLLTKLFISGPLGGGKQWWPWISLRDEVSAIAYLLKQPKISGPVNLTAPTPETSRTIMVNLARQMKRPFWLPAPAWAIKILLGQAGDELLLSSQKVSPEVLLISGFSFTDSLISSAIAEALR